ncbi:MAG: hypothetical protein IKO55_03050 [Kiritimatiellae bacterium]|nr:hypothetical protein [Kiritimatiellia bacterium]
MKDSIEIDDGEDKAPVLINEEEYQSRYLTPSEIALLREEFRDSGKWIRKQLGLPECLTV